MDIEDIFMNVLTGVIAILLLGLIIVSIIGIFNCPIIVVPVALFFLIAFLLGWLIEKYLI